MNTNHINGKPHENEYPTGFQEAVLKSFVKLPDDVNIVVKGYDFNRGLDYEALFDSYMSTGIQATNLSRAEILINNMIKMKVNGLGPEDKEFSDSFEQLNYLKRPMTGCTIFLGYTSNMASCGVREIIRYLAEHNLIDVIITSAGGVEEDFIKCLSPFYIGDFDRWPGKTLRSLGVNRTGNLLIPNDNYAEFESWLTQILDTLLEEQNSQNINWTPSKLINRLGKEINNPDSIYYWCYMNKIPVFCPGITDGAIGDILYSHSYSKPGLRLDVIEDVRQLNGLSVRSKCTGMIVLGGGISKHHTFNANLMRNGADYCVMINSGQEFDASDSGARPDEAMSWGKIKGSADPVKIYADAALVFPILVARTFVKYKESMNNCK